MAISEPEPTLEQSQLTPYHAHYFAYELTKRYPADNPAKLSATLMDAQVDLNPHQIEAALFAFRSPLSQGAILADEVGLGKTIEAGIVLSQKWAEDKKRILIIGPSSLRKQWAQELQEKFFLPSVVLESRTFNKLVKQGKRNPFEQSQIVICSYHFARNKAKYVQLCNWDLVVIDEAHRLRNVYKPNNRIGKAIKKATSHAPKLLLTATPLQNSLMELYGLVSLIDEHVFGDVKSFRSQFARLTGEDDFDELKSRLAPICKRNLRRQVQEYINYTNRIPLTFKFKPSDDEQALYSMVTEYLQRDLLFALPASQRHLLTLILRKLLASSTYAIAGTLEKLIKRLQKLLDHQPEPSEHLFSTVEEEFEAYGEIKEEWEVATDSEDELPLLSQAEIRQLKLEIEELQAFHDLAMSITHNAKGERLTEALKQGLGKMQELGAKQKAIIFTESSRTQRYLFELLTNGDYGGEVLLFNGQNNDATSKQIYKDWLAKNEGSDRITGVRAVDIRAALVDHFREEAQIMIATEAAAEGINLQFCSLLINYDLPWNPQRIEQRIGRCHRYGQKYDVVVVNFLNTKNAADRRVFQLLDEKFQLFSGVFGASDEILGSIESGVDFERRIAEIYQRCRTDEEISQSFDTLQQELEDQIETRMKKTRQQLLENFDMDVVRRLKVTLDDAKQYIGRYEQMLFDMTRQGLGDRPEVRFGDGYQFTLTAPPFPNKAIDTGLYQIHPSRDSLAHKYRLQHPLAQGLIQQLKASQPPVSAVHFDHSNFQGNFAMLRPLLGHSGWLALYLFIVESFEHTDHLLFAAMTDEGNALTQDQCLRLFELPANTHSTGSPATTINQALQGLLETERSKLLQELKAKDDAYFLSETTKLNKWADDRVMAAEQEIRDTKKRIREYNRLSRQETDTAKLLEIQKKLRDLQKKQRRQRQEIFDIEEEIEEERDQMIEEIEVRMKREVKEKQIFLIRWELE